MRGDVRRHLQQPRDARRVVVGAAIGLPVPLPEVIVMGAHEQELVSA